MMLARAAVAATLAAGTMTALPVGSTLVPAGSGSAHARRSADYGLADRIGDAYVASLVKLRLFVDIRTTAADIDVDARRGVVTLSGQVPGEQARAAAEANAAVLRGVDVVRNRLEVQARDARAAARDARPFGQVERPRG